MGIFYPFLRDPVRLVGAEAAGRGLSSGAHAASLVAGEPGVLHGAATKLLQDRYGQISQTHSVSAGLDYPGVGPEHAWLQATGRAQYVGVTDQEALEAFQLLSRLEGVIPALESAHAVAWASRLAPTLRPDQVIIVNLSGRGDKDVQQVQQILESRP
jgi:tryptophan synthase beta chain